jgi:hypothetical protein
MKVNPSQFMKRREVMVGQNVKEAIKKQSQMRDHHKVCKRVKVVKKDCRLKVMSRQQLIRQRTR